MPPPPKGLEPCALLCYEALRGVYQLHRAGLLPEETAKSRKGDLAKAYAGAQRQRDLSRTAYAQYQEAIRRAGTKKSEIVLAFQAGKPAKEILPLALDCIAAMTGEEIFPRLCQKEEIDR